MHKAVIGDIPNEAQKLLIGLLVQGRYSTILYMFLFLLLRDFCPAIIFNFNRLHFLTGCVHRFFTNAAAPPETGGAAENSTDPARQAGLNADLPTPQTGHAQSSGSFSKGTLSFSAGSYS
jgi:hypothetical protein